ncbi:MAG: hypothetical protein ACI9BD_001170, partial [Candidatus Marinamargulisbacteria bacterium]
KAYVMLLCLLSALPLYAHGISEADKSLMLDGGYLAYVRLGATHMVTGYDHLLFLLGVIFFLTSFKRILIFITAFTIGHSITLIFATALGISANYYLVDAVIALSVCYKGFENIGGFKKYLNLKSPNLVAVVFLFGLVHGFGLSTRLQQLPLGDSGLIMRILSFNVGVEVGQVFALLVMVTAISGWRKRPSFSKFSNMSNKGLIVAGLLLFVMQMHGYLHTKNLDDFGFSRDNHSHAHEEIQKMTIKRRLDRARIKKSKKQEAHRASPPHDSGHPHVH